MDSFEYEENIYIYMYFLYSILGIVHVWISDLKDSRIKS